jgi:hypothetical protein
MESENEDEDENNDDVENDKSNPAIGHYSYDTD